MNNLSQFKKAIKVGSKVECILNVYKPELQNTVREVVKVQTNGYYALVNDKKSWLEYPKASDCIVKDDILYITEKFITDFEQQRVDKIKNWINEKTFDEEQTNRFIEELKYFNEKIEKRKQDIISNGGTFIDDNNYIWYGVKLLTA
jgi:translation initiation factor 2B subunit (eIF-2B alpha/beta/delta family)